MCTLFEMEHLDIWSAILNVIQALNTGFFQNNWVEEELYRRNNGYPGPRGFLSSLSQSNLSREVATVSRRVAWCRNVLCTLYIIKTSLHLPLKSSEVFGSCNQKHSDWPSEDNLFGNLWKYNIETLCTCNTKIHNFLVCLHTCSLMFH